MIFPFSFWGAFSPKSLPNLSAWYDVSDFSSLRVDSANRVSLVGDKSGNSAVNCLVLNGVASNNALVTTASVFGAGDFSVSFKIRSTSLTSDTNINQGGIGSFGFVVASNGTIRSTLVGTADNVASTGTLTNFVEYVIAYVRTGTSATYYINGVTAGTITDSRNYSVASRYIGSSSGGTGVFGGNIKWARHYSVALSPAQVLADAGGVVQANATLDVDFTTAAKLATSFVATIGGTVTINTSGATGARISGERDLYQGTVANQPIYLSYSGSKYAYYNGTAGSFLSTPDSAAVSVTGDIDLRAWALPDTWNNSGGSAFMPFIAKLHNNSQASYDIGLNNANPRRLYFRYTPDGSFGSLRTAISTADIPFSDGTSGWVRATYATTGTVIFYTSTDGVNWTQLGTSVAVTAGSIFDGTDIVTMCRFSVSGSSIPLKLFRAQIYNGINGTLAFDFNAQSYTTGSTLVDQSVNAATITINGGATIVTAPALYFDGSNDYLKAPPFALSQPETVQFVGGQLTWSYVDYFFDGNSGATMVLQQKQTTPELDVYGGNYIAGTRVQLPLKTRSLISSVFNGASSLNRRNKGALTTGNAGILNAGGLAVSSSASGGSNANITTNEIAIYNSAQSTAQLNQFANYAGRKWGFTV